MISLETLCINEIAEEFEKFHQVFMDSNEETVKQDFYFLQRNYSYELLSELSRKGKLKSWYLDYLLNEHLKTFDSSWLIGTSYENSIADILCRVPNVTKLSSTLCSDEILKNVAKFCPKIVQIVGWESSITDEGVKYLCKNENGNAPCPNLKRLDVRVNGRITDECLIHLIRDLPTLETIFYIDNIPEILYSIHREDLPGLENVHSYNLIGLNLLNCGHLSYYTDLLKMCLTVCPRLKSLRCPISDKKQLDFFKNTRLKKLCIQFLEAEPKNNINIFFKNHGYNLSQLNIRNCMMSTSVLAISCPKLKLLQTNNVTFLEDDSQPVLHSLRFCIFENTDISLTKAARLLSSSSNLYSLYFNSCFLSSDVKTHILKCCENCRIIFLTFTASVLEINFVKDILLCFSSLEVLSLHRCGFCPAERKELEEFSKTLPCGQVRLHFQ